MGDFDQAIASLLRYLDLSPDNSLALMNLGGIYQEVGELEQSLAYTLKSLELKSDNPNALTNMGLINKELDNPTYLLHLLLNPSSSSLIIPLFL